MRALGCVMTKGKSSKRDRYAELQTMLEQRRADLLAEMQEKMRHVRTAGGEARSRDPEAADIDHEDIDLTLIQLKSETLTKIEVALQKLEKGTYGGCSGCGRPIAASRLRALPFATRCLECEETREAATTDARAVEQRRLHTYRILD